MRDALIRSITPFREWLPLVGRASLRADLLAGLTGAVMVLPQGVAFAAIAGLPPEYGLYCAIVPTIVAALFGSSHHLVSGPTTAISIVVFSNLSRLAAPYTPDYVQLAITLTFLVGLIQLGLGLARMGGMVNFVSHSVVVGFTTGAALLIATAQIGHVLGLTLAKGQSFLTVWAEAAGQAAQANGSVALVAGTTLVLAVAVKHWRPRWPALLLAMIGGSLLAHFLGAAGRGVALVGALPDRLPPLSGPDIDLRTLRQLMPGALAVAMLGLAEAVSISRAVAGTTEQRIDNNQEFVGQGLSNLVGSFFSAYASSGSFTRSGINYDAGARTPLAAVFAALALAAVLLLVAPLTAYLPIASMGGVILLVAWHLIDAKGIHRIFKSGASEASVFGATFLSTLFLNLEFALISGVLLSLLLYLRRTSHPHFTPLAPARGLSADSRIFVENDETGLPECPQLKILRLDGSIFFGAVNHIVEELHSIVAASPEQYHLLIVGSGINFVDLSGCRMLFQENHSLVRSGRILSMCSLKPEVLKVLQRGKCVAGVGPENFFHNKSDAVAHIVPRLDPERCRVCRVRVFAECARMPGGEREEPASCPLGGMP